jgi:hypothetical protein
MYELDLWHSGARATSHRTKMHVGVGKRRPHRAACGRELPIGAERAHVDDLEQDPSRLCRGCERALGGEGPWTRWEDWVRPPVWVSSEIYVGSPYEAWQLNALTWSKVVSLAKGQQQTREAIGELAEVLAEAMDDPTKQHVAKALGDGQVLAWAGAVSYGWWPPSPKQEQEEPASPAWWLAWLHMLSSLDSG